MAVTLSSFVVDGALLRLQDVLGAREGLLPGGEVVLPGGGEVLLPVERTPDLPLVVGALPVGERVPSARKGAAPFELPRWRKGSRQEGPRTVDDVSLTWTGELVEEGQPIAVLEIAVFAEHSAAVAEGHVRRISHTPEAYLRTPSRLSDGRRTRVWDEWRPSSGLLVGDRLLLTFPLHSTQDVQRVYQGLTSPEDDAEVVVEMTAPCVRPQRKVQILDATRLSGLTAVEKVGEELPVRPSRPGQAAGTGPRLLEGVTASQLARLANLSDTRRGWAESLRGQVRGTGGALVRGRALGGVQEGRADEGVAPQEALVRLRERDLGGGLVVGGSGAPAVVRFTARAEARVVLDIDPALYPELFHIPAAVRDAPRATKRRRSVTVGGRAIEYFEDEITPGLYYYRPDAYRLARSATPPHRPLLMFAFVDEQEDSQGGDEPARVSAVEVTCSVAPAIDHVTFRAIAQQVASGSSSTEPPVLLPLSMGHAEVELTNAGGDVSGTEVSGNLSVRDGGTLSFRLDAEAFSRLFARLRSPGPAITGTVRAADGALAIPLECSFFDPAGGPVETVREDDGLVLHNRSLGTVDVAEVLLVDRRAAASRVIGVHQPHLDPGSSVVVQVPDGTDLDAHDVVVSAGITAIPGITTDAFWWPFALTRGHLTTGRDVRFAMPDPAVLAEAPADPVMGALTGIRVEVFRDRAVTLDAAASAQTVRVRTDAIASLLADQQQEARDIIHRVVDVHERGDGAAGGWTRTRTEEVLVGPVRQP